MSSLHVSPAHRTGMALIVSFTALALLWSCATVAEPPAPEPEIEEVPEPFEQTVDPYDRMSAAIVLGDPLAAIEAYETAKIANPEEPETLVLLGNLYIAAGDITSARELLEPIAEGEEGPAAVDARLALSLLARIEGDRESELEQLSAVLQADPENGRANSALGEILLEDGEYDEAEVRFGLALDENPEDFIALQGLGNTYLRNGKSQDAIAVFSDAIEVEPEFSYNFTDRARAYVEQGLFTQAISDMDSAIELDGENGWHFLDRGRMRARSGLFDQAEADFTRAIELLPDNFLALAYRAQVYAFSGRYEAATADYYGVLEARPDYYPAYAYLGALEYINGNNQESHDLFVRAFNEDPRQLTYVLFAAAALFAESELDGERFLENNLNRFERGELFWLTARYYTDNVDLQVLTKLQSEENRTIKAYGQFYMALRYTQQGLNGTARALLDSAEQQTLDGSPESVVRDWLRNESP